MKTKLATIWASVKSSLWFIPGIMLAIAVTLAYGLVFIDRTWVPDDFMALNFLYTGGFDGARTILSTIAGSMITVAGVTFSITMVALTMTTAQFGPRLISNFMKDRGNQIVLGTFVATFVYCLLVSRTIQVEGSGAYLPRLAVSFSILLAVIDLGVLVYFFHHASSSIHADHVVQAVYEDLRETVDKSFPEPAEGERRTNRYPVGGNDRFEHADRKVRAGRDGYVQALDIPGLMETAAKHDLVIRTNYRAGDYVYPDTTLADILIGQELSPKFDLDKAIRPCFYIGIQRTNWQDIEFSISQLVEVAIRAISPGINDPFTAMSCIDRIGAAVTVISGRKFPQSERYDDKGELRLLLDVVNFDGVMDTAFHQIRQYSRRSFDVQLKLLETLGVLAGTVHSGEHLAAVERHLEMVYRAAKQGLDELPDSQDAEERYQSARRRLSIRGQVQRA